MSFTPTQHEINVALSREEYGVALTAFNLKVLNWLRGNVEDAYNCLLSDAEDAGAECGTSLVFASRGRTHGYHS